MNSARLDPTPDTASLAQDRGAPQAAEPSWPSGHVYVAFVVLEVASLVRVVHAFATREVFGAEATLALLAVCWAPFVIRDLVAPRYRRWRAARAARRPVASDANGASAVDAMSATRAATRSSATVIRLEARRPRQSA